MVWEIRVNMIQTQNTIDGEPFLVGGTPADGVQNQKEAAQSFDKVFENHQEKTLEDIFNSVAEEYEVPVRLLKAVAQAESGFDTNAVSSCGASGIMQLMPKTAEGLGVEDVFDAEQNITGGAKMLAYLLDDYDGNTTLALAAYNAGSGAVSKYGGVPPYEETKNYINKINDILEGELEADTTNISIAKNGDQTGSTGDDAAAQKKAASDGSVVIRGNSIPVKTVGTHASGEGAFSYEEYLQFLELYQKMLEPLMETATNSQEEEDDEMSEQQKLYQIQSTQMQTRAQELLGLK